MRYALPILLLILACEPNKTAPVQVMAMVIGNTGNYEPREVTLTQVEDVVNLKGNAARLLGGARIQVSSTDPLLAGATTDREVAEVFVKSPGVEPKVSYVERQGVLHPADFHSWNMVTTYYNFERAWVYFQDNGMTRDEWLDPVTGYGATVYYAPNFTLADVSDQPMRDNALWYPPVFAFAVLPFDQLQEVPLAMNSGVMAHEFAHRVFNLRAYGGAGAPTPFSRWVNELIAHPAVNVVKGVDEGLADYHAFGASCGTPFGCTSRFLQPSLGPDAADLRDFRRNGLCMTSNLRNAIATQPLAQFTGQGLEYQLGTLISAALWRAAQLTKRQTMERAVLAAYDDPLATQPGIRQLIDLNAETPDRFTLAAVAISILQHITDPILRRDTCDAFQDILQISKDLMIAPGGQAEACPAASANPGTCPNIN